MNIFDKMGKEESIKYMQWFAESLEWSCNLTVKAYLNIDGVQTLVYDGTKESEI